MAKLTILFVVVAMIAVVWSQQDDVIELDHGVTAAPDEEVEVGRPARRWRNRNKNKTREEGEAVTDDDDYGVPARRKKWRNRVRDDGEDGEEDGANKSKRKKWRNRNREDGDELTSRRQWRQRNRQEVEDGGEGTAAVGGCGRRWCQRRHNATNAEGGQGNMTRPRCNNGTEVGETDEAGGDTAVVQESNRGCWRQQNKRRRKKWRKSKKRNQTTPQPMTDDDEEQSEEDVMMEE